MKKKFEIMVPLKYLSNFGRNLKMPLIICEVNLTLTWLSTCFIKITDVKLYVPVIT